MIILEQYRYTMQRSKKLDKDVKQLEQMRGVNHIVNFVIIILMEIKTIQRSAVTMILYMTKDIIVMI